VLVHQLLEPAAKVHGVPALETPALRIDHEAKERDAFADRAGVGAPVQSQAEAFQARLNSLLPLPEQPLVVGKQQEIILENGLKALEIDKQLIKIQAGKILVIIDACESGKSTEEFSFLNARINKETAYLSKTAGITVYTAVKEGQPAFETPELKNGILTYAFIEGIKGKADTGDNKITVTELGKYLEERVLALSYVTVGNPQIPGIFINGMDFEIGEVQ